MLIDAIVIGGAQKQFVQLSKLLKYNYDIQVLVYHNNSSFLEEELMRANIPINKLIKNNKYDFFHFIKLMLFMKRGKFDVCISFLDTPNFYNEIARILGFVKKSIVSERSAYFKNSISIKKRMLEFLHFFADVVTTNSISQKERTIDMFPFLKDKIWHFPNIYKPKKNIKLKKTFNNKFIVLSNLNYNKNFYNLVLACKYLKENYPNLNLNVDWYGRYPINQKCKLKFKESLNIINENNLGEIIEFFGEIENVVEVIPKYDALIHISQYEGCSNSVCEAMLLAKPVILSNVCDHPFMVNNNNGFITNQNCPIDIAKTLHNFISLKDTDKHTMSKNSLDFMLKNFSIAKADENINFLLNK